VLSASHAAGANKRSAPMSCLLSGWTIIRLSRNSSHQLHSKIRSDRSERWKHGQRVRLRTSMAIRWRSAIVSNASTMRVWSSLRATRNAPLIETAMNADYPQPIETTNEFAWIKF